MVRYLLTILLTILVVSCTDRVAIDSSTIESYEKSLSQMKQGLSKGELFQLEFALTAIGASSIPSAKDHMAEVQSPEEYTMKAVHGKNRQQIIKLAKKLIEKKAAQFR
ncbi:hypothetical protein FKG94_28300 [Exilibacterium tricleocarpae]|uniref:Uncharacterized protein n=1 Tax=Exilibacterium tricleocarpae TaxID=2591008 RepID=A0A545SL21_9GAMM|nr:hypothetical protein [Exilibacterium tricleocarpae]TQV65679.1 hypothetical protein FKG94_28300 [Exilibacterium tricleocarpae]